MPPESIPPLEDVELMALVAQGDPWAREHLASRLCARVQRIQRGLLGHPQDADDAAQETLVEVLRASASFRGEASVERWADRIAVRTGLRFRRRQRRHAPGPDLEPDALPALRVVDPPAESLPRPLLEYLDRLPTRERHALFLKHALGYSAQEVAEMTQTALSTTKYRISAALARLRKEIRRDLNLGKGAS